MMSPNFQINFMKHQAEVYKGCKTVHYINATNPNGCSW